MSGEDESEDAAEWQWAHILWQKRGIRFEEYAEMPMNVRLAYIASEELARDCPLGSPDRLAKVMIKTK